MVSRRKIVAGIGGGVLLLAPVVTFLGRDKLAGVDMMRAGEAPRALAKLEQMAGPTLRAIDLTIDHRELRVELQNAASPDVTDRWSVSHLRGLRGLIDWEPVGGPDPVNARPFEGSVRDLAFDLRDVDFAAVPKIAAAAVARIALQEHATATEMSLSRSVTFGLSGHVGQPRWAITVRSAHESARAFADVKGRLTGTDLAGTLRAQRFDLYQGGQPLLDTVRSVRDELGGKERIRQALIYRQSMRFEIPHPQDRNRTLWYDSNIDGAHPDRMPELAVPLGLTPMPEFATGDVDWGALPRLLGIARDRLEMPDAGVQLITIRRNTRSLRAAPIMWEFDLRDRNGDEGSIALDAGGAPTGIRWPSARQDEKRRNFLAREPMTQFLATLHRELGPGAMIMELLFGPDDVTVELRDPDRPDRLARLTYTGFALERSAMPPDPPAMYEGRRYDDSWLFELHSLDPGFVDAIPSAETAAIGRLALTGGVVTAIGVGRHVDELNRTGDVNIEIVVKGDDRRDGRYFADLKGRPLRADAP